MPEITSMRGRALRRRTDLDGRYVLTPAPGRRVWPGHCPVIDADGRRIRTDENGRINDYTYALDRACTSCHQWLPQTTDNFWAHPTNGTVSARCRPCYREARSRYNRPARNAAGGRSRAFGVEMELTSPAASVIIEALTSAGIAMARHNVADREEMPYDHTNTNAHHWTLKHDGSVNGHGLELVSPKLSGRAGFEELERVCRVLNEVNATVDRSCGVHVHHDFRGLTIEQIRRQVHALVNVQDRVMRMVAPSRRHNDYTPAWRGEHISSLLNASTLETISRVGPRGVVNMWAYSVHGSVEVRAHAGTTSYQKIAAWIRFGQAVFAAAEAGTPPGSSEDALEPFLVQLIPFGLKAEDVAWLTRFETAGESRQTVERRVAQMRSEMEAAQSVLEEVRG